LHVPATYADQFAAQARLSALLFKTPAVRPVRSQPLAKPLRGE
jgi:hypothetical protein